MSTVGWIKRARPTLSAEKPVGVASPIRARACDRTCMCKFHVYVRTAQGPSGYGAPFVSKRLFSVAAGMIPLPIFARISLARGAMFSAWCYYVLSPCSSNRSESLFFSECETLQYAHILASIMFLFS